MGFRIAWQPFEAAGRVRLLGGALKRNRRVGVPAERFSKLRAPCSSVAEPAGPPLAALLVGRPRYAIWSGQVPYDFPESLTYR